MGTERPRARGAAVVVTVGIVGGKNGGIREVEGVGSSGLGMEGRSSTRVGCGGSGIRALLEGRGVNSTGLPSAFRVEIQ